MKIHYSTNESLTKISNAALKWAGKNVVFQSYLFIFFLSQMVVPLWADFARWAELNSMFLSWLYMFKLISLEDDNELKKKEDEPHRLKWDHVLFLLHDKATQLGPNDAKKLYGRLKRVLEGTGAESEFLKMLEKSEHAPCQNHWSGKLLFVSVPSKCYPN